MEDGFRHIGMTNNIVRLTYQVLKGIATDPRKDTVSVENNALAIGTGEEHFFNVKAGRYVASNDFFHSGGYL